MLHKLKDFLSKKKQADPLKYHSTYKCRLAPYGLALALVSLPAQSQQCTMFDVWGNSGICNRFPSHVEAEQHYDACFNTVEQFMPKLDSCLNELEQIKNDQDKEPIIPPSTGVKGCDEILQITPDKNFIYKQSAPIRESAIGSPIIGFRQEPTLIMNEDISSKGQIPVLDSSGKQLFTCPWATATGHKGGRARCTVKTSDVRRKAIANTGSPSILFKVNPNQCVLVPDAGRCVNSVKGQCDRLID
jgi:hypothetical protein